MKILFKWAGIFAVPSVLFFLYVQHDPSTTSVELMAFFFVIHYLSAGAAIYFVLSELKKKSIENVSFIRYMITGVLTTVSHALIFGLFSGIYFNYINTDSRDYHVNEELLPALVRGMDSTANTKAEYYDHLMAGKDSGVLLPERYEAFKQAANDSLAVIDQNLKLLVDQNFTISGNLIKWVGFAPIIGIFFSVIVIVFIKRR